MFGKKNEKLETLKDMIGSRAAYMETVQMLELDKREKDIFLRASLEVKKKKPNQEIIDGAYAILIGKSFKGENNTGEVDTNNDDIDKSSDTSSSPKNYYGLKHVESNKEEEKYTNNQEKIKIYNHSSKKNYKLPLILALVVMSYAFYKYSDVMNASTMPITAGGKFSLNAEDAHVGEKPSLNTEDAKNDLYTIKNNKTNNHKQPSVQTKKQKSSLSEIVDDSELCNNVDAVGCFKLGNGFPGGSEKRLEYYKKSCDMGYGKGCYEFATNYNMFKNNEGSERKYLFILTYYDKACKAGYGCEYLASLYAYLANYFRNAKYVYRQIELYHRMCDIGICSGCTALASMYKAGYGYGYSSRGYEFGYGYGDDGADNEKIIIKKNLTQAKEYTNKETECYKRKNKSK
jgi:hypothetical protein